MKNDTSQAADFYSNEYSLINILRCYHYHESDTSIYINILNQTIQ